MLCCCLPVKQAEYESERNDRFAYPGRRRQNLVPTAGNALSSASSPMSMSTGTGWQSETTYFGSSSYAPESFPLVDYAHGSKMPVETSSTGSSRPFSMALDDDIPPYRDISPSTIQTSFASPVSNPGKETALMKVAVPYSAVPGSTIHVRIPGENRLIAARIPPNCSEFYVSYEPATQKDNFSKNPITHATNPSSTSFSPSPPNLPPGKKLLLVHVPPGTLPGSTLNVAIPGEQGRLVQAKVPLGNVSQFHVAYTPYR